MAKVARLQKANAMRELEQAGIAFEAVEYEDNGAEARGLGARIAKQLNEDPGQGFKTLVTVAPSGNHVVCCIPVAEELDLKAAARAVGEKSLAMLPIKELVAVTGYVRGGCSPVGMRKRLPTVIDETCILYDAIHISGGRRGLSLTVGTDDLVAHVGAVVASITR